MATQQSGAEAPGASEGSGPESTAQESAAPQAAGAAAEEASAKPDLDETKRKFREALERKRGNHASAQGADHTGKVHGSHG
ncbi:MAG TPA: DUF5302 domain-containing protein, partial [Streptosporangiaceae bacterium]|nr:DUF5302 domain-containing protein [Streptosporangiaceae bacterium]